MKLVRIKKYDNSKAVRQYPLPAGKTQSGIHCWVVRNEDLQDFLGYLSGLLEDAGRSADDIEVIGDAADYECWAVDFEAVDRFCCLRTAEQYGHLCDADKEWYRDKYPIYDTEEDVQEELDYIFTPWEKFNPEKHCVFVDDDDDLGGVVCENSYQIMAFRKGGKK